MKNVLVILLLFAAFTLQAQQGPRDQRKSRMQKREMADFTPEQRAELRTKRMVLQLELTEAQQKEIEKLNEAREIERAKIRLTEEERSALSQEQRFTHKNAQLDAQIAYEREVKKILSDEQFEKFQKMRRHKAREGKRKSWRKNG